MGRYGKDNKEANHGKRDDRQSARDRLHKQLVEMAKRKPDGAAMQEVLRQDIDKHGPNPGAYKDK